MRILPKGHNIKYEVLTHGTGKRLKIYFMKREEHNVLIHCAKLYSTHYLEQIFDEDDQLISEELKELI